MKVWVVDWSEDDNDFIQPAGKTYHKTEVLMIQFIDKMFKECKHLMPISKNFSDVNPTLSILVDTCGTFEAW